MYDTGKVIAGLLVFVGLFASPFWYQPLLGKADTAPPQVAKAEPGTQCVLPQERMRAEHMQVIYDWRETVVRGGERIHVTADGRELNMSLSNTCLGCHGKQAEFCAKCHEYLAVKPFCWDCHFDPKEIVEPKEMG